VRVFTTGGEMPGAADERGENEESRQRPRRSAPAVTAPAQGSRPAYAALRLTGGGAALAPVAARRTST
jgi:hypothetical protein